MNPGTKGSRRISRSMGGFTLIELLVAAGVFLVISSAAFSLFNQHLKLATRQQNLSAVNIGMRNAMAQLEMDLGTGGQNLLGTVQTGAPVFGIGVIVQNNVPGAAATCQLNSNMSYPIPSACFDSLIIPTVKPCAAAGGTTAPVLVITDASDNLNTTTSIGATDNNAGANMANDASCFQSGDEILVMESTGGENNFACTLGSFYYCLTVVTLTANATSSGSTITLKHSLTGASGQGTSSSDPLGIVGATGFQNAQATTFSAGAYVVDLGTSVNTVSYSVQPNPSNATDPQLMRCLGGTCSAVVDQVIGFKVGAALWDNKLNGGLDLVNYFYNAADYCNGAATDCTVSPPAVYDPYDFSLIRAVRISMIARTTPNTDQSLYTLQNGFDNGPYLVQQGSVVVDLRNMSNNEFDN